MPILASEALLHENKKISNKIFHPVSIEPRAPNEPLIPSPALSFLD